MKKYLQVFHISFQQEFAFRMNFIMWRVRNIMQMLLVFYLWDSVFADPNLEIFGYDRSKILTYVFGILIVRAFVLSARTVDVAGEISRGELTNYLLKPVNYFAFWLTRDLSSKALNLMFATAEALFLYFLLKPPFFIQTNPIYLLGFAATLIIAIVLFFLILFIVSLIPFWAPELAWGAQFLIVVVITEFLSGALFPLDILPAAVLTGLRVTPFPYLIFFPIQTYLGQVSYLEMAGGLAISCFWVIVFYLGLQSIWKRGLAVYRAEGR